MKDWLTRFFRQLFLIDDSPHKVAAGAALGIFFGIMPGEGVATTLIVATACRVNRLSAMAGVMATNMWTTALALPPAAVVGARLFHVSYHTLLADFRRTSHGGLRAFFTEAIWLNVGLPLAVGFIVVAGAIAALSYAALWSVLTYRKILPTSDRL